MVINVSLLLKFESCLSNPTMHLLLMTSCGTSHAWSFPYFFYHKKYWKIVPCVIFPRAESPPFSQLQIASQSGLSLQQKPSVPLISLLLFLVTFFMLLYPFCHWQSEWHMLLKIRICCISVITFPVLLSSFANNSSRSVCPLDSCWTLAVFKENPKWFQDVLPR